MIVVKIQVWHVLWLLRSVGLGVYDCFLGGDVSSMDKGRDRRLATSDSQRERSSCPTNSWTKKLQYLTFRFRNDNDCYDL